jgi:hypothetical protein
MAHETAPANARTDGGFALSDGQRARCSPSSTAHDAESAHGVACDGATRSAPVVAAPEPRADASAHANAPASARDAGATIADPRAFAARVAAWIAHDEDCDARRDRACDCGASDLQDGVALLGAEVARLRPEVAELAMLRESVWRWRRHLVEQARAIPSPAEPPMPGTRWILVADALLDGIAVALGEG